MSVPKYELPPNYSDGDGKEEKKLEGAKIAKNFLSEAEDVSNGVDTDLREVKEQVDATIAGKGKEMTPEELALQEAQKAREKEIQAKKQASENEDQMKAEALVNNLNGAASQKTDKPQVAQKQQEVSGASKTESVEAETKYEKTQDKMVALGNQVQETPEKQA